MNAAFMLFLLHGWGIHAVFAEPGCGGSADTGVGAGSLWLIEPAYKGRGR